MGSAEMVSGLPGERLLPGGQGAPNFGDFRRGFVINARLVFGALLHYDWLIFPSGFFVIFSSSRKGN